ncbi:MAG: TIGR03618 family F420-dependent PPOX class oxidoreductase [Chloroflexi bacterium]|nr:TIGR03618 family F420-dependent PPOX class oxidoreductase [Chloroflexota bacterium]
MTTAIPDSFRDLLTGKVCGVFTTVMPDGSPQSTVVWMDFDGTFLYINTMRGFRKEKNMRLNPKVTLLAYTLDNPLRSIEVRGCVVEMTEVGALEHLDNLSARYTGRSPYFGACVPAELKQREIPVLCKIRPMHVTTLDCSCPGLRPEPLQQGVTPTVLQGIPESHLDLLVQPVHGILTTLMPDGQPQSSIVWCDTDGTVVRVNTTCERQKGKNMLADPRVSLVVIDPANAGRWIAIRGEVEIVYDSALEHLDQITRQYTAHSQYYGHVMPAEKQGHETRIICKIKPTRITLDAIH